MKRLFSIILVLILLLGLTGCMSTSYTESTTATLGTTVTRRTLPQLNFTTAQRTTTTRATTTTRRTTKETVVDVTTTKKATQPTAVQTTKPITRAPTKPATTTTPQVTVPTFSSITALRDYMTRCIESDQLEFSFVYTGNETLTGQYVARMTNVCYINLSWVGNCYTVKATEYPGDRIVDAYRRGNTSTLNADEKRAMNEAIAIVNTAKAKAKNQWELEVLLHDVLCDRITYDDHTRNVSDPLNPPHNLTVVGALLEGRANCQGYADAFYTVASIAGFTVSRMSVDPPNDLHMVNTILLNGSWYIVDVDSNDYDEGPNHYSMYNVGREHICGYTWEVQNEMHPIASTSSNWHYYRYTNTEFKTMDSLVEYMKNAYSQSNQRIVRGMLYNTTDGSGFSNALNAKFKAVGPVPRYTYWYSSDGKNLYFWVEFKS